MYLRWCLSLGWLIKINALPSWSGSVSLQMHDDGKKYMCSLYFNLQTRIVPTYFTGETGSIVSQY